MFSSSTVTHLRHRRQHTHPHSNEKPYYSASQPPDFISFKPRRCKVNSRDAAVYRVVLVNPRSSINAQQLCVKEACALSGDRYIGYSAAVCPGVMHVTACALPHRQKDAYGTNLRVASHESSSMSWTSINSVSCKNKRCHGIINVLD